MGQDIASEHFGPEAFQVFTGHLREETALLGRWFGEERFSHRSWTAGFELESWLIGPDALPLPINEAFLDALDSELVVPELSRFNVEINGSPTTLTGRAFSRLEDELDHTWRRCQEVAEGLGASLLMIGILPTLAPEMLNLANMSSLARYAALNEQLMALRQGRPIELAIDGREHIRRTHPDLMLEAATTSFQIHLGVRQPESVRLYNAALALSAPMVAVSANSPLLFGQDIWDETRIPLFEQAVAAGGGRERVSFGTGWCRASLLELFTENLEAYPVLIPAIAGREGHPSRLAHLRMHNGTIWRWNRPLVGFDHDGLPHLRIEHRVVPAGPTVRDCIANAALFYGLMATLGRRAEPIEHELSFDDARRNFYAAARHGLGARLVWPGAHAPVPVDRLFTTSLLADARAGLLWLGIPGAEADYYLEVVHARVTSGRNGARWQRAWIERHGRDLAALTRTYLENQQSGEPVHGWPL